MSAPCPLCARPGRDAELQEAGWLSAPAVARLAESHPGWRRRDGACPACVQEVLLELLRERGEDALHETVQRIWPLDAEAAFGALPTPLRLHADPRFRGRGTTLALVDSGFFPHPDLVEPRNRIRAWADASGETVVVRRFGPEERPRWPGWDHQRSHQWHGLMTSVTAAGNGRLGHGFYRGLASEADVVLVQVADRNGRIGNPAIARALRWLESDAAELGLSVVSLSLGGDAAEPGRNPVDEAVAALARRGVAVVAAAGNDGVRRLVPPGTAPEAITVGGLDDKGVLDHAVREVWHSNHGAGADGRPKPEVVAPSLWVVAPVLPHTALAQEAQGLFERRAAGDAAVEPRLAELKLVSPFYQHVEGTSFAAPVVASLAACLREARPDLGPEQIEELLCATAQRVPGAPPERQGAGAVDAGRAVAAALER